MKVSEKVTNTTIDNLENNIVRLETTLEESLRKIIHLGKKIYEKEKFAMDVIQSVFDTNMGNIMDMEKVMKNDMIKLEL